MDSSNVAKASQRRIETCYSTAVETRAFGSSGISVSALGLGAGPLGDARLSEKEAEALLGAALDAGITLLDTARSYGLSEERLGRHLGPRRHQVVLSTKGGYGVEGVADWTAAAITRGIDDALRRMRTDRIDLFHLHSCPLDILRDPALLAALDGARAAGKLRVAAYAGENDELAWAARSGHFQSLQCSVNLVDQRAAARLIPDAHARGLGVIAKRPLANAPWRPTDATPHAYVDRMRAMALDPGDLSWPELALRWSAFQPGVASAIAGTTNLANLRANAAWLARGPLPAEVDARIRAAFAAHDDGWQGVI
jgi:aryl-alcohol dehydrogenase-like predicted oxidoreductase